MVLLAGCGAHLGYRWDSEIAAAYTTWRRWRGGIAAARRGMNLRRTPSPEQSHRPPPAICPYPPCLRPLSLLRPTAHARLLLLPSISLPFSQSLSLARCLPTGACRRHRIPALPLGPAAYRRSCRRRHPVPPAPCTVEWEGEGSKQGNLRAAAHGISGAWGHLVEARGWLGRRRSGSRGARRARPLGWRWGISAAGRSPGGTMVAGAGGAANGHGVGGGARRRGERGAAGGRWRSARAWRSR